MGETTPDQSPRQLLLVRHAIAETHNVPQLDFNRQLHTGGILQATELGKRLAVRGITPDWMLSSPAPRALQTAIILADYLKYPQGSILAPKELYNAGLQRLVDALSRIPADKLTVVLVNHNPTLSELVTYLSRHSTTLPTAGLVSLHVPGAWADLSAGSCQFEWHDFPVGS